ncbi:DMT family transporter [Georhizobium sp. MAB10]
MKKPLTHSSPPAPSPASPDTRPVRLLLGIVLTVGSTFVLASMDALSKLLTGDLPVVQVVWGRYFFHTLIVMTVLALRAKPGFWKSRRLDLQLVRALLLCATTFLLYASLIHVPLADATAVLFFAPVLVTLLAYLVLGESVGPRQLVAVVVGFLGVLLIIRPGFGAEAAMLIPLGAAVLLAFFYLLTRLVGRYDGASTTLFYTTSVGAVLFSLALPFVWETTTLPQIGLMAAMGSLGALGHFLLVRAFAIAPASSLSPFLYSQIVAAATISVVVFGDPLQWTMIAGAGLLVGSGIYVWLRS